MKLIRGAAVLFALAVLAGCATTKNQMTLEELDASLAKNDEAATRLYPGKSVSEVRGAAQQALYLLDPDDIKFDVQSNALVATRWSTFYAVFAVGFGRDWYSVNFERADNGAVAKLGFVGEMNTGMIASAIPESFKRDIPVSAHQNRADFKLFHDRVEYLLGLTSEWPTCETAKRALPSPSETLFLCDSLGLDNTKPKNAMSK